MFRSFRNLFLKLSVVAVLQLQTSAYLKNVPSSVRHSFHPRTTVGTVQMSSTMMPTAPSSTGIIQSTLKKASKTLAVCLEYVPADKNSLNKLDLEGLSMQLRKSKATAIWTPDVHSVPTFVEEQQMAAGNFPGPCPVIFNGDESDIDAAIDAGVTAVVLSPSQDYQQFMDRTEIIWKVATAEEIAKVVADHDDNNNAFLVEGTTSEQLNGLISSIPKGNVVIASIDAMQSDNAEIDTGKELKSVGCTSVLLRAAVVGDGEDLEYALFAVDGLTRKKSSEFGSISGLTGSTNGHFGGVASTSKSTWRRKQGGEQ